MLLGEVLNIYTLLLAYYYYYYYYLFIFLRPHRSYQLMADVCTNRGTYTGYAGLIDWELGKHLLLCVDRNIVSPLVSHTRGAFGGSPPPEPV